MSQRATIDTANKIFIVKTLNIVNIFANYTERCVFQVKRYLNLQCTERNKTINMTVDVSTHSTI